MTQGRALDAQKRRMGSTDERRTHAPDKGGHGPSGAAPVPRESPILLHAARTLGRREHDLTAQVSRIAVLDRRNQS